MADLKWNTEKNDIAIENGDFILQDKLNVQNAFLFLFTKNCFLTNPLIGVGIDKLVNSNYADLESKLNEWKKQVISDGAKTATFKIENDLNFTVNAIY